MKKSPSSIKYRTPSSFQAKVFNVVKKIPRGKVMTYKEVAQLIGSPKAYRAVGNALNKNVSKDVPCHRVIKSNGTLGGFRSSTKTKEKILKKEVYLRK